MSARVFANVLDRCQQVGSAKLLLVVLANYANDEGTNAYPSYSTLAEKLNITERQVKRLVADLVEQGELSVIPRYREDGSSTSNMYQLSERYLGDRVNQSSPARDAGVVEPGEPEFTPRSLRKEKKENSAHVREEMGWQQLRAAVAKAMRRSPFMMTEKEDELVDGLYASGYTAEQIGRYYGAGGYWRTRDWRGVQNQPLTEAAIRDTIGTCQDFEEHPENYPAETTQPKAKKAEVDAALATFKSLVSRYGWPNWDQAKPVIQEKGLAHVVENLGGWGNACRMSEYDLSRQFATAYKG